MWQLPIVWTLRDQWAMTGGCHLAMECRRFEEQCGACPLLNGRDENDLSRQLWQRKASAWQDCDITFVGISRWVADCARRSSLLRRFPIKIIWNAVDTKVFSPSDKGEARNTLGLPQDSRIVLFGATNAVNNPPKGYSLLIQAMHRLIQKKSGASYQLVVFGSDRGTGEEGIPITFLGHVDDDRRLASLYSAADVFAAPSVAEAFGKTAAESLACGTPVVAFRETGLADVVHHRVCGYLAPLCDSAGLATGIQWVVEDDERWRQLSANARQRASTNFTLEVIAAQYRSLYESILTRRGGN